MNNTISLIVVIFMMLVFTIIDLSFWPLLLISLVLGLPLFFINGVNEK